jgi:hypothetical protein
MKMPPTTDDELRRAIEVGRRRRAAERRAASVQYDPDRDAIEIELTDGAGVRLPRGISRRSADRHGEAAGFTGRIRHQADEYDINISVHGLIGALATAGDIAASLGKLGGAARSEAKRTSARVNGAKSGRPRKTRKVA